MRVEICIAKEKISKMPKGSVPALQQEMLRRVGKRYDDVDVIVKSASNDGLTILRAVDKESVQEFVQETLQEVWETADDWFIH
ncbi:TPA: DinI-like family protein [Escherichia coli]|uniref:DinI-like family protein n=1 Tax=Escherichia coli TaxID=562 RepID=UPI000539B019|nr:DinI-like family protein [Escherichia coli]HDX3841066.1 DinI-like family protein [Escherichia coli]HDX3854039.1 DinI-like family protein [Escherichia coli]HDX3872807.1 DinI-like family protein [Escherichia coli]HDX3885825.1 DinI-like family protein [Escherichia coli]HDX3890899.1 DinI-like family protein [Escherichia coli]